MYNNFVTLSGGGRGNMPGWFNNLKDIFELLSYVVTTIGLIAIALSIKEFNKNLERDRKQDDQLLIQNSIDVLRKFAEEIIPEMSEASEKLGKEINKQRRIALSQINDNLTEKQRIDKLPKSERLNKQIIYNSKNNCNYGRIFNQLEQVSVYMNYKMVKEELVYIPIHKTFIDFVGENINYLNDLRSADAPYANVITLYNSWNDKNKIEKLERQKDKVEKELRRMKNN